MAELQEIVVDTPERLASCCTHLASQRQIGFDTEFIGESTYHPNLCLIQTATVERLYIIDPQSVGSLDQFWPIDGPNPRVVVHAGREEARASATSNLGRRRVGYLTCKSRPDWSESAIRWGTRVSLRNCFSNRCPRARR